MTDTTDGPSNKDGIDDNWIERGVKDVPLSDDPDLLKLNMEINKLLTQLNNENNPNKKIELYEQLDALKKQKTYYLAKKYIYKLLFYGFIFCLVTFNLIAVAVSMTCNRKESIIVRAASALYAFFFGIVYILYNYKYIRLTQNKDYLSCTFCPNNPFAL